MSSLGGDVYLPSGTDPAMKNSRENYAAETIPQILINAKDAGCIGGDWNNIVDARDATKNANKKQSNSLKRLIKTFSWIDSFRQLHPNATEFSRYYDNSVHGEGASRLDRMYHYGNLVVLQARYVGIAFSDHFALIVKLKVPENLSKSVSPKSKPMFKSKQNVIKDPIFQTRLKESFLQWQAVRENTSLCVLTWWELVVKPSIRRLLIERGKELNKEKRGILNLLQIRQSYLVKKIQSGELQHLADLHFVQGQIIKWHRTECDKVKLQAKCEEINSGENVRIYHHEMHKSQINRSSILKLETQNQTYIGHDECSSYLEDQVSHLLLHPAELDSQVQAELLREVHPVFTEEDNTLLSRIPTKKDVKSSVSNSNLNAAPGTDGITSFFYHHSWDIVGDALTEVVQAVHAGQPPTLSQRTSLMVFACKPKKPKSVKPSDKRKISLLNSDFKIITGIINERLKVVATHTLSPCQLAMGSDQRIHHGINRARDAITAAGKGRDGVGILDNDFQAAFDFMVLPWVIMVLKAKGLAVGVINHINNLYMNNFSIVVVNNIPGKKFENVRGSIRQGDKPSSSLFCYGIDPHLVWLDKRLRGIPIYSMPAIGPALENEPFPISVAENYKVLGYIDDVKPAITTMAEFLLVDHGSRIFEKASGCRLHRDPASGKVKFLPLGRWRGTLTQDDIPVNYIAISEHLDMVGVVLKATHTHTRKANGDILVDKVKQTIGRWQGGKFMPLTLRCHSVNSYCLPKIWFKCGSIDLREGDFKSMVSKIKSWVYADQLIKPEELVLYKSRNKGGLNLTHIKYRALAELIKSFLDTAINPRYRRSLYHQALFRWHVEEDRTIPNPGSPPYYTQEFYNEIKYIKTEGLLRLSSMTIGMWYKALLERHITNEIDDEGFRFEIRSRIERNNLTINWEQTWSLHKVPGLDSADCSFLFCLLHNLLPTQERLHRTLGNNTAPSPSCNLCNQNTLCDQLHALVLCPFNSETSLWIFNCLRILFPNLQPSQLLRLEFNLDSMTEKALPVTWLVARTFHIVWKSRIQKKQTTVAITRAQLEAGIMLMRKTRFKDAAITIDSLISAV